MPPVLEQAISDQFQYEPITAFMQEFGLNDGGIDLSVFDDRNLARTDGNGRRELRLPRW